MTVTDQEVDLWSTKQCTKWANCQSNLKEHRDSEQQNLSMLTFPQKKWLKPDWLLRL